MIPHVIGLALTLVSTGCLSSALERVTVPTTDRWKAVVAGDDAGTVSPDYPLDVTEEMVQCAHEVAGSGRPEQRLQALQDYLFDRARFPFEYSKGGTYTAIEAFEFKQGNCVTFTMLFIALARSVGINVHPALLRSVQEREREGELIIVNNHVVAVYKKGSGVRLYDFAQSRESTPVGMRILEDNWITAMYLNNLGAQDLREDRLERAQERLEMAVAMAGDFAMAFNNLGVVYRRRGDHERAFNAYVLAMNGWGAGSSSVSNLRQLYLLESGYGEGARLPVLEDLPADTTLAVTVRLGHAWMARGRTERALQLYRRAVELAPESIQPILAQARAELYRRRPGMAIKALSRALSREPDHPVAEHLASFLKLQMTTVKPAKGLIFRPD